MAKRDAQELNDTELDGAAGAGDGKHKDWIDISTMSQPILRSSSSTSTSRTGNAETVWKTEEGEG